VTTPEIRPRWEWRTFASSVGPALAAFDAMASTGVQESDETYLLAPGGDVVKVRDGLLDVKLLREVSPAGLQRWEPVLKAAFPVGADDVTRATEALGVAAGPLARATYTLDEFLDEVARPSGAIRVVPVHKRRVRYRVNGCSSEVSDVDVEGRTIRTIAIESEDADAVLEAVHAVGLDGFLNQDYRTGLAAALEGRGPRFAVIDVGTNSVKFHLAQRLPDRTWQVLSDRAEVTRLGEDLRASGSIGPASMERTIAAIEAMVAEAGRLGADAVAMVGTAGLRASKNRAEVVAAIRARTGVTTEVIDGEEEGRLAFLATQTKLGLDTGTIAVFDTGGGSTQFTFGREGTVDERFSVEVGAVRYTEHHRLDRVVTPDGLAAARAEIAADLVRIAGRPRPDALVGMGGAVTNMAAVMHGLTTYDPDVVGRTVLDRSEVDRQIERYASLDADGRRSIVGLQPSRAEVILAGACIVRTIMDLLDHESLRVSDRGLRHHLLVERFGLARP
jgi:exopolyphosphatase/guanosine-5'-triphosphate,3'-diphosphate pyrophosphatase